MKMLGENEEYNFHSKILIIEFMIPFSFFKK